MGRLKFFFLNRGFMVGISTPNLGKHSENMIKTLYQLNFKFKKSGARLPTLVVLPLKVERTIPYSLKCFKIGVLQYVRNWSTFSAPLHRFS